LTKAKEDKDIDLIRKIKHDIEKLKIKVKEMYQSKLSIWESNGRYTVTVKGREKVLRPEFERARKNVQKQISDFYKAISNELPELERHLLRCIETASVDATYRPDKSKRDKSIKWYISW
jgi:hypothetical protein